MGQTDPRAREKQATPLARAVAYQFLASCFSYPNMELIRLFGNDSLAEVLDGFRVVGLDASTDVREITAWLESAESKAALDELEIEYTRLFVNAYPRIPTPPYSSVYLDKDRQVWGPSTAQAGRFYEEAGLCPSADFADIPDHIAAELEFVSYLILQQHNPRPEASTANGDAATIEVRFLADHLLKWASVFFSKVGASTESVFYGGVARLAFRFVDLETKQIDET